jgi:hypothetical protein
MSYEPPIHDPRNDEYYLYEEAMSDPNNLEGPPPTPEERAAMARELDKVAPNPAEKFELMFGHRLTPRTDAVRFRVGESDHRAVHEVYAKQLERELAEARALLAAANKGAERNAEALRISSEKLNEAREQRNRLAEACRWAQRELGKHTRPSPIDKALVALKGGADE